MDDVTEHDKRDVATAVTLVTLYGSGALVLRTACVVPPAALGVGALALALDGTV